MSDRMISLDAAKAAIEKVIMVHALERSWGLKPRVQNNFTQDVLAALDSLPGVEADGRWEKLRAFVEAYRPSCGDTTYAIGLQNACDVFADEMDRLSAPAPAAEGQTAERP